MANRTQLTPADLAAAIEALNDAERMLQRVFSGPLDPVEVGRLNHRLWAAASTLRRQGLAVLPTLELAS